ncbi:MAG: NADH:ubiquinone reductase (Na(+)-transporting) subunit A [Flavobacteriales bacterium]|jgi:Na+-transporting NADH:ubiquinone oxidoreductase subunit A|nr:NADH:ubiquinone reductase (Na(+)-transporting) subunit A [Flavobacteriales bacterium]|tara:strand:+ start:197 stop:1543 length:1347 start_codon:yes stop_codon:yes gene_type:complete
MDIKISKGADIKLKGVADRVYANVPNAEFYAVQPPDFHLLIPKMIVSIGDIVKAGDLLFYDKNNDKIKFSAPVSGVIADIERGAKRKILRVIIKTDSEIKYKKFPKLDLASLNRNEIIDNLLNAGLWPFVRQRPFGTIANPSDKPKSIFISAFDSSPLAPDNDFIFHGDKGLFQLGLDIITQLCDGTTHLNLDGNSNAASAFSGAQGVQINNIYGPHPAGNVGVQIHHINPINKGDVVWYISPQDVVTIARYFKDAKYDASKIIALTGAKVKKPRYYRVIQGASLQNILSDNLFEGEKRVISGNVLSGSRVGENGYIGFYDFQVSVITEGNYSEFFGWLLPGFHKYSLSRTFFSWLNSQKEYDLDTNTHGEERAYVVTGQYESYMPIDVFPVHLIKAILIEDIELMENLGIYEVDPEDFALCEYACTSKVPVQSIIRRGLDLIKKECS